MISVQDIPDIGTTTTEPTVNDSLTVAPDILGAEVSFDTPAPLAGIPQSSAPDLSTFGENPWDIEEREETVALDAWRSTALDRIDKAALDPDGYFKGADLSFAASPKEGQRLATIDAFLQLHNGGDPLPDNEFSRSLIRQEIALTLFDGKGATDDGELYQAIVADAQGRKDRRALATTISQTARDYAITAAAGTPDPAKSWAAFREQAKSLPGYNPELEPELYDQFHQAQNFTKEALDAYQPELARVWKAMRTGGGNPSDYGLAALSLLFGGGQDEALENIYEPGGATKKDAAATAMEIYGELSEEDRPAFMDALGILARSLPKEQQPAFWANMNKSGGRTVDDLIRQAGESGKAAIMKATEDTAGGDPMENRENTKAYNYSRNFASEVRRIQRADFDPVKSAFGKNGDPGWIEEGAYMAPGAIASTVMAAVPGVGLPAMFLSMEGAAYDTIYGNLRRGGMTEEAATEAATGMAPLAAIPQTLLEKLQANAILGNLPFMEKAMTALGDKITSNAARFATRAAVGAVQETAIETAQEFIPHILQETAAALSQDIPGVDWKNGKDGVLDGFWAQQGSTMIAMLPLAIFGAAGGISADARLSAFQNADDTTLLAFGIRPEDLADFRAAQARGKSSASAALPAILEKRDAQSESAREATKKLVAETQAKLEATADPALSSYLPRFDRTAEGWNVIDSQTGETIGTAQTANGALGLAARHTDAIDMQDANAVAYLASMLEAGDVVAALGNKGEARQTTTSFRLGDLLTAAQMAESSPEAAIRIAQQLSVREQAEGGDGGISGVIFGDSVTDPTKLAAGQRRTVNRIQQGASVLTVFHEETHGFWREAVATGRLTTNDALSLFRSLDSILGSRRTKDGDQALRFIPENFDTLTPQEQATAIDEAVSELMEAEILRTRKGSGKRKLPPGLLSRNLSAIAKMAPEAARKFSAFIRAMRAFFGLALQRSAAITKGIQDGTIDAAEYDTFLSQLLGTNEQEAFDAQTATLLTQQITGESAAEGDPFSIGRATVTPTASTQTFPTKDGGVIGPASFSIGAYHGTPHKVDKFTTAKMGTGEGAQAFGWGLYFAENESVARNYRDALAGNYKRTGGFANPWKDPRPFGSGWIVERNDGRGNATFPSKKKATEFKASKDIEIEKANDTTPLGNLYSVTLKVEEDELLYWEKPFAEQPQKVQAVMRRFVEMEYDEDIVDQMLEQTTGDGYIRQMNREQSPADTSAALAAVGIKGIRYLDGNSRADGQGSYNYVIFNDADIEITEENGQTVNLASSQVIVDSSFSDFQERESDYEGFDGVPFSIGNARIADVLRGDALARIRNPQERIKAMQRITRRLEEIHLQMERLELAAGGKRMAASLRKEAAFREAARAEELENDALARHSGILSDDDLTRIKAQPAHAYLADPESPLRGQLDSRSAAIKRRSSSDFSLTGAEYDGSEGISRSVFGGTMKPDVAAQNLFEAGIIAEPTTDALWDILRKEQNMVATMKEAYAAAKEDLRQAKLQAKRETNQWLAEQTGSQARDYSPKQEILRALSMLDAILAAVPAEIRGKIGGYTQLASIGSYDLRLAYLRDKLARVDKELESYLRIQFGKEMEEILRRSRPQKDAPGERPKGKLSADVHSLFRDLEKYMGESSAEVEGEALKQETLAATDDTLTPEEVSHKQIYANLLRLMGNWTQADAARREAAVAEALRILTIGYDKHRADTLAKSHARHTERMGVLAAIPTDGSRAERRKKAKADAKKINRSLKALLSFASFEQLLTLSLGKDSPILAKLTEWERRAAYAKADNIHAKEDALADLFKSLAGGNGLKAEQLRHKMATEDTVTVTDWKGEVQTFSQTEAITATLMWRQEDGKRHMEGHMSDETGQPVGEWHWRQEDIDAIEDQLTPESKAVRLHLIENYSAEYDRLNPVYESLNGVALPRNKQYSPLTVKPAKESAGQTLDPVSGSAMSGPSLSPGSLRTRSQTAVAEPDFRDALATYIAHTKQMEHYMAYAPFVTEAMAVLNTRDVSNAIKATAGEEARTVLGSWLDYFAAGGNRDAAAHLGFNRGLNRAVNRLAAAALVGRVSVLAIQSTQLGAALAEMPTAAYVTRLARLATGNLGWKAALDSEFIQRRMRSAPPIVAQALEGLRGDNPNALKYAMAKLGDTISGADALFTGATYAIIYDYQLKLNNGDTAAAHAAAEAGVERVAQPTRPGTRSLYENTGTNPLIRISWSFASEPRQKLALAAYNLATGTTSQKARALAVTWIAGGVFASLIRAVMRDIRDSDDDEFFDEKNWDPKRLTLSSLTGPLAGLPVIGDAIEAAAFGAAGEYLPEGNLFSAVPNSVRGLRNVPDWFTGDRAPKEMAKDIEAILYGTAPFSSTGSAATSASHVLRDVLDILDNFLSD